MKLGQMKQEMKTFGLQQLTRRFVMADGTVITCSSIFGQDQISIAAPAVVVEQASPAMPLPVLGRPLEFVFIIDSTGLGLAQRVFVNVPSIAPHPITLAVQDGQLVVLGQVDEHDVMLSAVSRALARADYSIAENLLISMESTSIDGALYCDEGFFVDPTMYAGKVYEDRLLAVTAAFHREFNHAPATTPTYPIDAAYDREYSFSPARVEKYQDAFFVEGTPRRLLSHTTLVGAGGSLVTDEAISSPAFTNYTGAPGYDNVAVGTQITHELQHRRQTSQSLHARRNYTDTLYVRTQVMTRNYQLVNVNDPASQVMRAGRITEFPSNLNGPTNGELTQTVSREKQRRTPDGWIVVSSTPLVADAQIMAFITNGASGTSFGLGPGTLLSGPPVSEFSDAVFEQDGVPMTYARTTYVAGDWLMLWCPSAARSVLPDPPRGGYSISANENVGEYYPTDKIPIESTSAERTSTRYSSTHAQRFELTSHDTIKIKDAFGVVLYEVPPVTPFAALGAAASAMALLTLEWNVPAGTASGAAQEAATRVSGRLNIYNPRGATHITIAPPQTTSIHCIYQASTGRFMYYRILDEFAYITAAFKYIVGLAGNHSGFPEFDTAGSLEVRKQAMLALVEILVNTGLPPEFVVLGSGMIL